MRTRNWSIRSKIIALAAVPLTALLALWVFATVLTAGPAFNLLSARAVLDTVGNPGIDLVGHLQRERLFSVEYLSATGPVPQTLLDQRSATDKAIADFRGEATSERARNASSDALRQRVDGFLVQLDSLAGNRQYINRRSIDAIGAQGLYSSVIAAGFQTFAATATFNDERIDRELGALTTVGHGQEYLSRVDALVGGATAAGRFDPQFRGQLIQDVGTARFLLERGVEDMADADRRAYEELRQNLSFDRLDGLLTTLVQQSRDGSAPPVTSAEFRPVYVAAAHDLRAFEQTATDSLTQRARPVAQSVLFRLGLAGIVGLAALIFSLWLSIKVGRSIVGRLRQLRAEAHEMAAERLPAVVKRLQRGEEVDVDVETPPLEYGRDEIGQLGQAFNDVQRTAVQSAVEEAGVRRGLNEVFLNIARRSQTLLHRQLALLDRMERRETEPQELEDLYRVDHLATRMRRHAEDLVILAGAAPGRGWRNPVPVIDVVRGAISEVEDYKRIDIRSVESAAVLGRAVGDVIHLLAELLENAASFSPPHTRVQVLGQVLPNGYAIEIEDRGLGMTAEAVDEANRRLAEPPDFDPADSARLGLFVVAQLAHRHGIRVSLRASAYAGITAIVLVPGELIASSAAGPAALVAGSSTGERPLVGSGTADPSRHSLAALQWQGTEELRQLTAGGRPVTIEGTAVAAPDTAEETRPLRGLATGGPVTGGQHRATIPGGPSPSSVAAGLSEDGLVQRRRVRRPADLGAADAARTGTDTPQLDAGTLASTADALRSDSHAPESARPPADGVRSGTGTSGPTAAQALADRLRSGADMPGSGAAQGLAGGSRAGADTSGPDAARLPGDALRAGAGAPPSRSETLPAPRAVPRNSAPVAPAPAAPRFPAQRSGSAIPTAPTSAAPVSTGPAATGPASAAPPSAMPASAMPASAMPASAMPASAMPASTGPASTGPAPAAPTGAPALTETEDGLPRRVRQANLAPQLRRRGGAPPPEPAAQFRSPEQVRSIMSALQLGTTRGRIDAARYLGDDPPTPVGSETHRGLAGSRAAAAPPGDGNHAGAGRDAADSVPEVRSNADDTDNNGRPIGGTFADAATVSFPAIVNLALARTEASSGGGEDAAGDRADEPAGNDVTRPEKDA